MRYLLYVAILALTFAFFAVRQEKLASDDIVENISEDIVVDPNSDIETAPTIVSENSGGKKQEKMPDQKKDNVSDIADKTDKIDEKLLNQIQESINKANQAIKEIERKNEEASKQKTEAKVRLTQSELYSKAESRVVNFFCGKSGGIRVASGIIISDKGHILTNAHVTESFDADYECMIRQGSPARAVGYAKPVMIPSAYLNGKTRQEQAGNDVSIWLMSKGAGEAALPESFPYYEIDPFYFPEINQPLATFSYPSELLGYETLLKSLNMMFAETIVSEFDANFILSTSGLSSQIGSSGGVLVDVYKNRFAGIIFGVSNDENISKRSLFSLTPNSIERIVKNETGKTLSAFLK